MGFKAHSRAWTPRGQAFPSAWPVQPRKQSSQYCESPATKKKPFPHPKCALAVARVSNPSKDGGVVSVRIPAVPLALVVALAARLRLLECRARSGQAEVTTGHDSADRLFTGAPLARSLSRRRVARPGQIACGGCSLLGENPPATHWGVQGHIRRPGLQVMPLESIFPAVGHVEPRCRPKRINQGGYRCATHIGSVACKGSRERLVDGVVRQSRPMADLPFADLPTGG